jgi:hypothetical protein
MGLTIQRPGIPVPLPIGRGGTAGTTPEAARTNLELTDLATADVGAGLELSNGVLSATGSGDSRRRLFLHMGS